MRGERAGRWPGRAGHSEAYCLWASSTAPHFHYHRPSLLFCLHDSFLLRAAARRQRTLRALLSSHGPSVASLLLFPLIFFLFFCFLIYFLAAYEDDDDSPAELSEYKRGEGVGPT